MHTQGHSYMNTAMMLNPKLSLIIVSGHATWATTSLLVQLKCLNTTLVCMLLLACISLCSLYCYTFKEPIRYTLTLLTRKGQWICHVPIAVVAWGGLHGTVVKSTSTLASLKTASKSSASKASSSKDNTAKPDANAENKAKMMQFFKSRDWVVSSSS